MVCGFFDYRIECDIHIPHRKGREQLNIIEMKEENLNIEWWHTRMILYALKKFDTQQEAADALGCSARNLIRKKAEIDEKISYIRSLGYKVKE